MESLLLEKKESQRTVSWCGWEEAQPRLEARRQKSKRLSGKRCRCGNSGSALDRLGDLKPQFPHLSSGDPLLKGIMKVLDGGWERPWQELSAVPTHTSRGVFHRAPSPACAGTWASQASAPGHLRTPSSPPSLSSPLGQSSGCRLKPGPDSMGLGYGQRWLGKRDSRGLGEHSGRTPY